MKDFPVSRIVIDSWFNIIESEEYSRDEKLYTLFELLHYDAISLNKCLEYCEELGIFSENKMVIDWNKSCKSYKKN
jgi:hypothetical protein